MTARKQRIRGVILRLVAQNQEQQKYRHSDYTLLKTLNNLGYEVYLNLVRELVQDLVERGALKCTESRNERTGEVSIEKIQLTPRGRDIVEGEATDPGIVVDAE